MEENAKYHNSVTPFTSIYHFFGRPMTKQSMAMTVVAFLPRLCFKIGQLGLIKYQKRVSLHSIVEGFVLLWKRPRHRS